jgi:hypothetical protein
MNELHNLYNLILEDLISLNRDRQNKFNIQSYLQSLQSYVKQLRESYKKDNVNVDYSNPKTQAAYLLAYYPHYVEMTYQALESLQQKDPNLMQLVFDKKYLKVCLFCAGAAPETLGLLSFIRQFYPEVKSIVIYSYDLYADTWRMSQDITKNIVNNCFTDYQFALLTRPLNINCANDLTNIDTTIKNTDIFMFQNCLNELETNQIQSVNFLLNHQPERSLLLINDLREHKISQEMTRQIRAQILDINSASNLKYNQAIFKQVTDGDSFQSSIKLPAILRENLLTGENGLIPKKYNNYSYVCVYKVFYDEGKSSELDTVYNSSNLLEKINHLQAQFNNFDTRVEKLSALESNYLEISRIVKSSHQKLEEFQATVQNQQDTTQADIDEIMLNISHQQETLELERRAFSNLANDLVNKVQLLESGNDEFKTFIFNLETLKFNIQNLECRNSEQERKLKELEKFQTTLQNQQDTTQADLDKKFSNLNDLVIKVQLKVHNIEKMNSEQERKLNEIDCTLNRFINEERKNLTRQLERNRKAAIFAILIGLLGVILGVIALFRLK